MLKNDILSHVLKFGLDSVRIDEELTLTTNGINFTPGGNNLTDHAAFCQACRPKNKK